MMSNATRCFQLLAATLPAAALATTIPPVPIYFGTASSVPEKDHALRNVRRAMRERPPPFDVPIMFVVAGHTDRAGTEEGNVQLSCARAQAVRDILVAEGVSAEHIQLQAFGETRLMVDTDDGESEPLNRRVEISYWPLPPEGRPRSNCF